MKAKKQTILIITDVFPPHCGGAGWSTYFLCKTLRKQGYTVIVLRPNTFSRKQVYDDFPVYNVSHPLGSEFVHLAMKKRAESLIKSYNVNIIHAQHMKSVRAIADIPLPKCATIRDYWPVFFSGTNFDILHAKRFTKHFSLYNTWKSLFFEGNIPVKIASPFLAPYLLFRTYLSMNALQKMDKIICVSHFVQDVLKQHIDSSKLVVVPNMVEEQVQQHGTIKKQLLFVGKLNKQKGFHIFAEALQQLPSNLVDTVKIIGEGNLQAIYEQKLQNLSFNVEFSGYLPNDTILKEMSQSITIIPSLWDEPLGRVHLEALSVGSVIISTNTGGTPDIIQDGKNGFIFDGTSKHLAKIVEMVMSSEKIRKKVSKNALKTAKESFSTKKVISRYEEVYRKISHPEK
jgi:glycogen(starch) synthase